MESLVVSGAGVGTNGELDERLHGRMVLDRERGAADRVFVGLEFGPIPFFEGFLVDLDGIHELDKGGVRQFVRCDDAIERLHGTLLSLRQAAFAREGNGLPERHPRDPGLGQIGGVMLFVYCRFLGAEIRLFNLEVETRVHRSLRLNAGLIVVNAKGLVQIIHGVTRRIGGGF